MFNGNGLMVLHRSNVERLKAMAHVIVLVLTLGMVMVNGDAIGALFGLEAMERLITFNLNDNHDGRYFSTPFAGAGADLPFRRTINLAQ